MFALFPIPAQNYVTPFLGRIAQNEYPVKHTHQAKLSLAVTDIVTEYERAKGGRQVYHPRLKRIIMSFKD
jgi:hypothetical protein